MNNKLTRLSRWILLLPGAILAGFLATFPLHWVMYLKFAQNGTLLGAIELSPGSNITIEYLLYPCIMAMVFVWSGYKIAPTFKFKVALTLFSLYAVIWIGIVIFTLAGGNFGNTTVNLGIRTVLALVGAGIGLYFAKVDNHQQLNNSESKIESQK